MLTIREKYFGNLSEAVRASEAGNHARAQFHYRVAARQGRQWSAQLAEQCRRLQIDNQAAARQWAERCRNGKVPF